MIFGGACDSTSTCVAPNVIVENITTTEITVDWVPGNDETSWEVEYKMASDSVWTSEGTVGTTPHTIYSLQPNTEYDVRVGTDCGEEILWREVSARTECAPFTLPFTEDFDSYTASSTAFPFCWAKDEGYSTYISASYSVSGDNSMYMGAGATLIFPLLDESVQFDSLLVSFEIRSSSTRSIQFGVVSDPSDPSTFEMLDDYTISTANEWEHVEFLTRHYVGTGSYLALRLPSTNSMYPYIDDITVDYIPSCYHVMDMTLLDVTPTTATIGWTAGGSETEWEYVYGPVGQIDTTVISAVYEDSVMLSDLTPNTAYEILVRANCGSEYSTWASYTFRTGCVAVTELPFTENFDSYTTNNTIDDKPFCWEFPVTYGNFPNINNTYASSGSNSMKFVSLTTTPTVAVLPQIDADIHTLSVTFQLKAESATSSGTFEVGVMSDPNDVSTFESVQIIQPADNQWHEVEAIFNNTTLTGVGNYIAFRHNSNSDYYYYWVDDIVVDTIPSCPRPATIAVDATTSSSVTLSWTTVGGETAWNIIYGPAGFDPAGSDAVTEAVTTNPCTISNLSSSTYEFYVQADCGGGEVSALRGPISATPGAIIMGSSGTQTVNVCSGHIFDNGGPTGNYSSSCNATMIIYPETPGNEVTIQGTLNTESVNFDYLKIYDGASASGTPLATLGGQNITVGPYTSTTGALTIVFISDGSVQYSGFDLEVSCSEGSSTTCDAPTGLAVSNVSQTGATATWTAGGEETAWNVQYKLASASDWGNSINVTSTNYAITGLTAGTAYQVRVQAVCGTSETSDWTAAVNFTTLDESAEFCPAPTELEATDVQNETITLTWEQEANTANSWEVQYRVQGSSTWNSATATAVPYTLTGLTGLTTYEIQVVANCTNGLTSDPSNMITVTTTNVGISSYDLESSVSLYPNPTADRVTISAQGMMESVSMYDVYGKLISTMKVNDTNAIVDLSSYASGVYFARITTENGVVTKRIVKK